MGDTSGEPVVAGRVKPLTILCLSAAAACGTALLTWDDPSSCRIQTSPAVVDLDNRAHARILGHAWGAIRAGKPLVLHLDRKGAAENRRESLAGIPTRRGFDRDEYPPAVSSEGGRGADVRYVGSRENRSAGSVMGRELRGFCDGQSFEFERGG